MLSTTLPRGGPVLSTLGQRIYCIYCISKPRYVEFHVVTNVSSFTLRSIVHYKSKHLTLMAMLQVVGRVLQES